MTKRASPLTVRGLDENTKRRLRIRAAVRGHSMEEEVRTILRAAVNSPDGGEADLGSAIHRRFAKYGGVELPISPREPDREPPQFDE
jgi:plasmid stability protein